MNFGRQQKILGVESGELTFLGPGSVDVSGELSSVVAVTIRKKQIKRRCTNMVQEGRGILTRLRSACNHYSEITTLFDTLFPLFNF